MNANIRSPIITVLGHIDHGKTTLLDSIRHSNVASKEAGGITQMIGASLLQKDSIMAMAKDLSNLFSFDIVIPGLLFIDTPGHEVFRNLRYRGTSIADLAILVIDIKQGIQEQTKESINILKELKTPFVIAANKIDLINGWKTTGETSFLKALNKQNEFVKEELEKSINKIIWQLSYEGFESNRFDRIKDFTKTVSIVPLSAKTKEGIAELLVLVAGLSQKYLKNRLYIKDEETKGVVIEVKEEKGLGLTLDCILYDGVLKERQNLYFITKDGIIERKVKAILIPNVASNYAKEKYKRVKKIVAAAGVKILSQDIEQVIPGSSFSSLYDEKVMTEVKEVLFDSKKEGIIVKVDSLGSAESVFYLLKKHNVPIAKIDIGMINKDDIALATAIAKKNSILGIIVNFNLPLMKDIEKEAAEKGIEIVNANIIYKIPELIEEKKALIRERIKKEIETKTAKPCLLKVLKGFFFRQSKPAIFGVEIIEGSLKLDTKLMNENGEVIGKVKSIQEQKISLKEAEKGKKVAISVDEAVLGRNLREDDLLYSYLDDEEIDLWEKSNLLNDEEKELLKKIKEIKKKHKFKKMA